jgi:SAM-dependent methyltransferase
MNDVATGQVSRSAADVYDEFFVPALFGAWAPRVADAADLKCGDRVLDVACGTGVLAKEAARRVVPGGSVVGLDRNEGMLAVARRKSADVEWRQGLAESLPFENGSFDAVVSQFGLMFFEDRVAAIREMWRVLRPEGRMAVAVWAELERSPGYAAMVDLLRRLFGERIAGELHAPFVLGDPNGLAALFADAAVHGAQVRTEEGTARFPSLEAWIHTDVKGWTLGDMIDDTQYGQLVEEAHTALGHFVGADGAVVFTVPAHIVTATKQ